MGSLRISYRNTILIGLAFHVCVVFLVRWASSWISWVYFSFIFLGHSVEHPPVHCNSKHCCNSSVAWNNYENCCWRMCSTLSTTNTHDFKTSTWNRQKGASSRFSNLFSSLYVHIVGLCWKSLADVLESLGGCRYWVQQSYEWQRQTWTWCGSVENKVRPSIQRAKEQEAVTVRHIWEGQTIGCDIIDRAHSRVLGDESDVECASGSTVDCTSTVESTDVPTENVGIMLIKRDRLSETELCADKCEVGASTISKSAQLHINLVAAPCLAAFNSFFQPFVLKKRRERIFGSIDGLSWNPFVPSKVISEELSYPVGKLVILYWVQILQSLLFWKAIYLCLSYIWVNID